MYTLTYLYVFTYMYVILDGRRMYSRCSYSHCITIYWGQIYRRHSFLFGRQNSFKGYCQNQQAVRPPARPPAVTAVGQQNSRQRLRRRPPPTGVRSAHTPPVRKTIIGIINICYIIPEVPP